MNIFRKKDFNLPSVKLFPGHEGIYHQRDIKYIIRMIRKLSNELDLKKNDIDWLQCCIESFLIMNSRVYDDLIKDLVKGIKRYSILPARYNIKNTLRLYELSLSSKYHQEKQHNRNRAAHGSNYQRVGVPEFKNDVLPKPLRYERTMELANMARRKDIIKMWQKDMNQCAEDISQLYQAVVNELNELKGVISI